jgi:hypothetical protein
VAADRRPNPVGGCFFRGQQWHSNPYVICAEPCWLCELNSYLVRDHSKPVVFAFACRWLQEGDPGGIYKRALDRFPDQGMVKRIWDKVMDGTHPCSS